MRLSNYRRRTLPGDGYEVNEAFLLSALLLYPLMTCWRPPQNGRQYAMERGNEDTISLVIDCRKADCRKRRRCEFLVSLANCTMRAFTVLQGSLHTGHL